MRVAQVLCLCSFFIVSAASECGSGDSSCVAAESDPESLLQSTIQADRAADEQAGEDMEYAKTSGCRRRKTWKKTTHEILEKVCTSCNNKNYLSSDLLETCKTIYAPDGSCPESKGTKMMLKKGNRRRNSDCFHFGLASSSSDIRLDLEDWKGGDDAPKLCKCLSNTNVFSQFPETGNVLEECNLLANSEEKTEKAQCVIDRMCSCGGVCPDFKHELACQCVSSQCTFQTKDDGTNKKCTGDYKEATASGPCDYAANGLLQRANRTAAVADQSVQGNSLDETLDDKCA